MDKHSTSQVNIARGELLAAIKNLKQKDWVKAAKKLGLWVPDGGGKGSHKCAYVSENCNRSDSTNLVLAIPKKIIPQTQTDRLKQLVAYGQSSGQFNEDDVWRTLKLLK